MRVAILYTGAARTYIQTLPFFKTNVLSPLQGEVFAVIQSDENNQKVKETLNNELTSSLLYLEFLDKFNENWLAIRDNNLKFTRLKNIDQDTYNYLTQGGSMIEHYQVYLALEAMKKWEIAHEFKYDYVLRFRTDDLWMKPMETNWLFSSPSETEEELNSVDWPRKMSTLLRPQFYEQAKEAMIEMNIFPEPSWIQLLVATKERKSAWMKYLQQGRFILTFRRNHIWLAKRELALILGQLGLIYGQVTVPPENVWFWNSENQFQYWCKQNKITQFEFCRNNFEDRTIADPEYSRSLLKLKTKENENESETYELTDEASNLMFGLLRPL